MAFLELPQARRFPLLQQRVDCMYVRAGRDVDRVKAPLVGPRAVEGASQGLERLPMVEEVEMRFAGRKLHTIGGMPAPFGDFGKEETALLFRNLESVAEADAV